MVYLLDLGCPGPAPRMGGGPVCPACPAHSGGGCLNEGKRGAELLGQNNPLVVVMLYHCLKNRPKSPVLFIICIHLLFLNAK